jgi:hypothetical protein
VEAKDLLQLLHIHAAVGCWATRRRLEAREMCEDMVVSCVIAQWIDSVSSWEVHMKRDLDGGFTQLLSVALGKIGSRFGYISIVCSNRKTTSIYGHRWQWNNYMRGSQ